MSEQPENRTFDEYLAEDGGSFTEWLRVRSEPAFTEASTHRFTRQLGDDTLDEDSFRHYIVQDYVFVEGWIGTLGHAITQAPTLAAKSRIVDLLALLTSTENDYFERTFDRLGIDETEPTAITPSPAIREFLGHMASGALSYDYEETLSLVLAEEWIYSTWANDVEGLSDSRRPHYDEWIEHHTASWLEDWVTWLRGELDEYGPELSQRRQERASYLFERTAEIEAAFFEESLSNANSV